MKTKFSKLVFLLCFTNLVAYAQDIPYGTTMESWKITDFVNDAYIDVQINRSKENYINIDLQYNNIPFLSAKGKYIPKSESFNLNRIYSKNGKIYTDNLCLLQINNHRKISRTGRLYNIKCLKSKSVLM